MKPMVLLLLHVERQCVTRRIDDDSVIEFVVASHDDLLKTHRADRAVRSVQRGHHVGKEFLLVLEAILVQGGCRGTP